MITIEGAFKLEVEWDLLDIENNILDPNVPEDFDAIADNLLRMEQIAELLMRNNSRAKLRLYKAG